MVGGEFLAFLLLVAVIVFAAFYKEKSLSDPSNTETIYSEQMVDVQSIRAGPVDVTLFRQSGNVYRELGVFGTVDEALDEIMKSFRRAKIDSVCVLQNTSTCFEIIRLHHNHRGSQEGKKLGGALVVTLET